MAHARKVLEDLKNSDKFNRMGRLKLPYILENFEIFVGSCHYSWCFTTQIRGGLANLLSTKWRLPNYIYIIFSNDQVTQVDVLKDEIYKILEGLFTFVNRELTARKLELPYKSRRFDPPKVTVIKTVAKSLQQLNAANFKNKRRTFNRALQKVATAFGWRSINIDSVTPEMPGSFDESGHNLSDDGMKLLWHFISDDVKKLHQPQPETKTLSKPRPWVFQK